MFKKCNICNRTFTIIIIYFKLSKVIFINLTDQDFTITRGMRIAQLVIAPVVQAQLQVVSSLDETKRGTGGFGSTGKDS